MKYIFGIAVALAFVIFADAYREVCIANGSFVTVPQQIIDIFSGLFDKAILIGGGAAAGWSLGGRKALG